MAHLQAPTTLTPWEKAYLCDIFCACLQQWKAQKNEAELGGLTELAALEKVGARQPPPPGRFERQGCVENELKQANHPAFQPEKEYRVGSRRRFPDVSVSGQNGQLTSLVEMKFPGDDWQPGQKEDYKKIAKANNVKLVKLDENSCKCK